ncbi:MAG: hypothetical protein KatS3mg032_1141 [Cyclobacteriaceae bacterium]|nr:MAG: hypothetical protein KatS3mg032_1141 [Cyclobacteriaceae bacterium]
MKHLPALLFAVLIFQAAAQAPEVPHKMTVAGITLTIRDDARREIQEDVNALTRSARHFDIKVQRARTYFPIIEQILREERVPDDFKYLVLQESALVPDAVSVSNAVGYWQFKDFTAAEMGLRVDDYVDERMNIVASTRAAARYLKKNNYYFNNWIYALQAYQMGAGAVMRSVKDYESGARHMEISSGTYWYVKKFLAHKIAFENAVNGPAAVRLVTADVQAHKTLNQLAHDMQVNPEELMAYNLWLRKGTLPGDKTYTVIVPVKNSSAAPAVASAGAHRVQPEYGGESTVRSVKNGIPVVIASTSDSWATLAAKAGVSLRQLLRYNDCSVSDQITAGSFYYIKPKKGKSASAALHVVQPGETLWMISQQHGIALKKLHRLNPGITDKPGPGTRVFLTRTGQPFRTASPEPVVVQVDTANPFMWTASSPSEMVVVPQVVSTDGNILNTSPEKTSASSAIPDGMHRVAAGETLYGIARKYNITPGNLLAWNNLSATEPIKPGQELRVVPPVLNPEPVLPDQVAEEKPSVTGRPMAVETSGFTLYEVKPSDTLYSIARQHGVTIKELMEWNGKKDFSVVPGEKLKIANR